MQNLIVMVSSFKNVVEVEFSVFFVITEKLHALNIDISPNVLKPEVNYKFGDTIPSDQPKPNDLVSKLEVLYIQTN